MLVGPNSKYHVTTAGVVTCVEGLDLRSSEISTFLGNTDYIPMPLGPWDGWTFTYYTVTACLEDITVNKNTWAGPFNKLLDAGAANVVLSLASGGVFNGTAATASSASYAVIGSVTAAGTPQPVYCVVQPFKTYA